MQVTALHFQRTAAASLHDAQLQRALARLQTKFVDARAAATEIRDRALRALDRHLLRFEREATARGTVVHWAESAEDVKRIVAEIADLCREAREVLRPRFLAADLGITGANFLVAETGSVVLVTNEGNGRLCTTLPRVHVALTGIEKVVPTLEDVTTLLRLLPRAATGQSITNYVSVLTGTKGADESDGPDHFHIILLDNGRSGLLGTELQPMLRCIRCGACMNHCPVYQSIGGHPYGWVYPGPIGSVLTPAFMGLENALDLPHASTLCGACAAVCPVSIPLPDLLRHLRHRQVERHLRPRPERIGLWIWSWLAQRPALYAMAARSAARLLRILAGRKHRLLHLPGASGWMRARDLPAPAGRTFRDLYRTGRRA
ncbi:MAG TPA: LUD domain-containing protein [bacterium]